MAAQPRERALAAPGTRAQIIEAATRRFGDLGYPDTRLEDVGDDVGIGRSAVLYHFNDKPQLYRAVLDALFGELLGEFRSAIMSSGELADRLEAATLAFVDYMARRPAAARIAIRESVNSNAERRAELQALAAPFIVLLEAVFEEGERTGVFSPGRSEPFHFISTMAGATLFYVAALPTFVANLPYDPLSDEQISVHKSDVLNIARRLLGIRRPRAL